MTGFEGSFLGAQDKISPQAIMECKICWTPYDPATGDDYRQIEPGTAFTALPADWSCPNCGAPKEQFMVLDDPGAQSVVEAAKLRDLTDRLAADFQEIWHVKMRDLPMVNRRLSVEPVGWQKVEGRPLGILISPWFMNLVQLPGEGEDWSTLDPGTREILSFPSGDYEFLHNTREMIGGYKACSLFSPMGDFSSQMQAREVAQAVMVALFDKENRAETDRAADIRAAREADLMPKVEDRAALLDLPNRRSVITGGMAVQAQAD